MNAPASDAEALRAVLRRDLTAALKARQPDAVAALRAAIAAIDNAQAVAAPAGPAPATSAHVAGASVGAGSAEVPRRRLSDEEARTILGDQVAEYDREAERYRALGRAEAAQRLADQARLLAAYLSP